MLAKMGDEGARLVKQAQPVKPHGRDRMAGGHKPHCRGWLDGVLKDLSEAQFCKHARDKA